MSDREAIFNYVEADSPRAAVKLDAEWKPRWNG